MKRVTSVRLLSLATLAALAACSNGNDPAGLKTGGDFLVLQTEPSDNGALFLNDAIRIDFSSLVNLETADLTTCTFEVLDQIGQVVAEPVAGSFELGTSPGDSPVPPAGPPFTQGRRLLFKPTLPTNDSFTNGGFRPGRTYVIQLVGGDRVNGTVLRDTAGKGLAQPITFRFTTADGSTPGQLFRNPGAGGPRRVEFKIDPLPDATGVVLNKLGAPPVEITLKFDQPLNPSSTNVPVALDINPEVRNPNARGRVFLEYDDPVFGDDSWIPAEVDLRDNSIDGSTLVLRPAGVLPNNASIRVIVEETLEDISGESNVSNAAYERVFGTFRTKRAYEQQFDGLVEDFALDSSSSAHVNLEAAFAEPVGEVGPGYLKAGFAFEGSATGAEFDPEVLDTVLNTNFTQVVPKTGAPYNVAGGVFNFKSVTIDAGKTVRGQGSNPMVWLVSGSFNVDGVLSVDGGAGTRVFSSGNANAAKPGGAGVCGGGDGGAGSPSAVARDDAGATGFGPLQVAGGGGVGGSLACLLGCTRGAGGGGGALATQGDPNYKVKAIEAGTATPTNVFSIFQQQVGVGGNGCAGIAGAVTRSLQGGLPGASIFVDARADNNFWGSAYDVRRSLRIAGELSIPVGGGGGGGGGDRSYNSECSNLPNFENDSSGGGGGGGGGVLIVKALGDITVSATGRLSANGGHGGGGEQQASCNRGGGGGGGAGGMVVLMSATAINIHAKGAGSAYRYASPENDYNFSISADGGSCLTSPFQAPNIGGKYVTNATAFPVAYPNQYDVAPLGGLGGMGIVQLMAPPGNNDDASNTILDDNINVFRAGVALTNVTTPTKKSMLAWRGFPNAIGQGLDDFNAVITIGDNEGDIRPSPTLLPVPFGGKSRLRSYWIDTGATARRLLLNGDDGTPRGILAGPGVQTGPAYEFKGVDSITGFASFVSADGSAKVVYPPVGAPTAILSMNANATFQGEPAYRVTLVSSPTLGAVEDRYTQYEAELLDSNNVVLHSYRIFSHSSNELVLSSECGALRTEATKVQLRAKFFQVKQGSNPLRCDDPAFPDSLGLTYIGTGGARVPIANVRIGFAFHTDPANSQAPRYPPQQNSFTYNLESLAVREAVRALGASFVQWDVTFDTQFKANPTDGPPPLSPESPRPELHFLRLPFLF